MAVCLTEWKVLPHSPIVEHTPNLWTVQGTLESGTKRILTAIRLADGRVLIHNAIALDEDEMARLDAWGEVAGILVPNAFHRMDCRIFQARYPKAKVYAPAGAAKAVAKATPVHGSYADAPGDATVRVAHLPGIKEKEGVVEVGGPEGPTLVFNDMFMNIPPAGFPMDVFVGPSGRPAIPRFARWFFASDTRALRARLDRLVSLAPARIVPGHGAIVTENAGDALAGAASLL